MRTHLQYIVNQYKSQEVVNWINSLDDWNVFATITTRYPAKSSINYKKKLEIFYKWLLKQKIYEYISYFTVFERYKSSDLLHAHSLLCVYDKDYLLNIRKEPYLQPMWENAFKWFGRSKFEIIESKEATARYITKYMLKTYLCDYDIGIMDKIGLD